MPSQYGAVSHVIFDLDGLLLNTGPLYSIATNTWLAQYSKVYPFEVKQKLLGRTPLEAAKVLVEALELDCTAERCVSEIHDHLVQLLPNAQLMPDQPQKSSQTQSGPTRTPYSQPESMPGFGLFDFVVCCPDDPDIPHGKPDPCCFLVTASKFSDKPLPSSVLVFEDALNGAQAARDAGMQCVLVPDSRVDRSLCNDLATITLDSLESFKPSMFGL